MNRGTLADLIAERAAVRPQATAVRDAERVMTYGALQHAAGALAVRLRAAGVCAESRVAVYAPPSIELVVACLAVAMAGGVYVPLDPEYPPHRVAQTIADAECVAVVHFGLVIDESTVAIRALRIDLTQLAADPPATSVGPIDGSRAAYMIYTSGSTGRPKGVVVTHANLVAVVGAARNFGWAGPEQVWCLCHSHAFDFSVWEMWVPLCHGGELVIVAPPTRRSPVALVDLLVRFGVTVLNQTPSAFRALLADGSLARRQRELRLSHIVFGGEALDDTTIRRWRTVSDGAIGLVNMYGITETTVHVTSWMVTDQPPLSPSASIIGRPLPHMRTYVLDESLAAAIPGGEGELFVGGEGVARGYHRRPALTAARFVPDPWSRPGSRMYRSGDRARVREDGVLEFLGRSDDQVKVRGVRLEPAEIEAILVEHRGVAQAAVVHVTGGTEPMLVAYLVATPGMTPPATVLRRHLLERLPAFAVPSHFVLLDALPLTPSGKLDRLALPPIESVPRDVEAPCVQPRTDTERTIATIWSELLNVPTIGVYDNFFELGGHSLLMTQVMLRLRERLDVHIKMESFFQAPTVAGLAAAAVTAKAAVADPETLDGILTALDEMSDEELEAELARRGTQ